MTMWEMLKSQLYMLCSMAAATTMSVLPSLLVKRAEDMWSAATRALPTAGASTGPLRAQMRSSERGGEGHVVRETAHAVRELGVSVDMGSMEPRIGQFSRVLWNQSQPYRNS